MKLGSWTRLQIEDWVMMLVAGTFTVEMFAINEVAQNGSNFMSPEEAAALTPDKVQMAIYGSKMCLVLEMFALATIWMVKGCLLMLYYRLTWVTPLSAALCQDAVHTPSSLADPA